MCTPEEHKVWNRRYFLQALGLVGDGAMTLANTTLCAGKPPSLAAALNTSHIRINLYNMLGQDVGTLKNAMLLGGSHIIDIKETIGIDLVDGQYIYKLMEVLVALANKF